MYLYTFEEFSMRNKILKNDLEKYLLFVSYLFIIISCYYEAMKFLLFLVKNIKKVMNKT